MNSLKTDARLPATLGGERINCYVRRHYFTDAYSLAVTELRPKQTSSTTARTVAWGTMWLLSVLVPKRTPAPILSVVLLSNRDDLLYHDRLVERMR